MVPRIQLRRLPKLAAAQCHAPRTTLPFLAPLSAPQSLPQRLQRPFSTCLALRQEPRQPHPPAAADPALPTSTTTVTTTTDTITATTAEPTPEPTPKKKRRTGRILFALTFTLLGYFAGSSFRLLLSPPTPPVPGSEEDAYTIRALHEQAAALPIVQSLTAAAAAEPDRFESWDAYDSLTPERRKQHITAGALAGSRGVGGFQRVWWDKLAGEVVSVVYFGSAATGWPGVVHGGCLATILDESCGRAAFKEWGGKGGMTACLGLEYKRMTLANGFYVVRVRARPEEELPEEERGKRSYKCWVDARIEDANTGLTTVVAEALFVGGEGKNGGKGRKNAGQFGAEAKQAHFRF
ncbi:HotDog domain-containing protein [Staphylotrichum tortipilum]|uniref:HotDog domain-containing protein n=1 Tax=Staphylotrichum tortipilum TaxID=2831512 RepID=A0AAN6MNQ3_9PEZI|nr:HotDog domain-containing protein [Staphylotrichum longicolle]